MLICLESHLANCLQDAFQVTASQEAAGFVGLNWKLQCFLLSLYYLTDGSLTSPWALAGITIWCILLQGMLLVGLWSEYSLCCWKIFHLSRFKMEMICSRLLPQDLPPLPFPPKKDEEKQMINQIMFCFHRVDCYESLVYSLLPNLKGIMLGWFQSSSLLVFFNVSKLTFNCRPWPSKNT